MSRDNRRLSICALTPYPADTAPSQRFRIEQWIPYLREAEIEVTVVPFADDQLMRLWHQPGRKMAKAAAGISAFARRATQLAMIPRYDAVFIHRAVCIAGPAWLEQVVKLLGKPVLYDFDDAIFKLHTTAANRHFGWLKFPGKTAAICRLSAHVVVGNEYLADYARQYNPQVTVIPTSIDTDHYQPSARPGPARGRVVVGWTGSATSQTHLEWFAPVLRELQARRDFELRVISNREPEMPGLSYVWRPWAAATEVAELSEFDLGIMPMPDDEWARGKCALKALQYMALGIPTVCAAVGANCEVIQPGENGLLAKTPEEWIACLEGLIDNPQLRARLGRAGRQTIEARYSMRHCAGLFAQVVADTLAAREGKRQWSLQKSRSSAP